MLPTLSCSSQLLSNPAHYSRLHPEQNHLGDPDDDSKSQHDSPPAKPSDDGDGDADDGDDGDDGDDDGVSPPVPNLQPQGCRLFLNVNLVTLQDIHIYVSMITVVRKVVSMFSPAHPRLVKGSSRAESWAGTLANT